MMAHVRLAAIDLDGTLLDDDKRVSTRNLAAVAHFLAHHGAVALATARDCASIQVKVPLVLPGLFYIGSGGAVICRAASQTLPWVKYVPPDLATTAIRFFRRFDYPVFLNAENDYWADRYDDRVGMIERRYNLTVRPFQHIADVARPIMRISLAAPAAILREAAAEAAARLGDVLTVSLASPDWLDLLAPQAGKGKALAALQAMLGVSAAETIAVGDYDCDLGLFAHAHHRVAMGNAVPALKTAATMVTNSNNQDGVAHALQTILAGCTGPAPRRTPDEALPGLATAARGR